LIVPPSNLEYPPSVATIPPTVPAFITSVPLNNCAFEFAPFAKAPIPLIVTFPLISTSPADSAKAAIFLYLLSSEVVYLSCAVTVPSILTFPLFFA